MLTTVGIATVRALVDRMSEIGAEKPFLINPESNRECTFAQLRPQSGQIARKLSSMGLAKGDKVAFLMDNGLFTSGLLLGAMYGGFVAVPLNVRAGQNHLAYTLDHCDTRLVFVSEDYRHLLEEARGEIRRDIQVILADPDEGPAWDAADAGEGDLAEVYPDDEALLMYTSGSTGHPKGAVHSHQRFLAAASNSVLAHQLTAQDRSLCVLPLYHINGVNVTLVPTLMTGGCVVMPRRFLVRSFWDWIARYRCTWSALVPTIISQLVDWIDPRAEGLEEALGQIRFLRSSSAPLPPSLHRAFEEKFRLPLLEAMGSTECGGNIFSNPLPPGIDKIGTPGLPYGFEARTIGADGLDVASGQPGEIVLRGPGVMTGYYKNPEATKAILRPDGWLHTGDLACKDEDGYFFIVGRAKELIIKGGMNIAPRQIDDALSAHPGVLEAAALGVPDPVFGEDIVAFAVLRPGTQVAGQELLDCCQRQLGLFKTPSKIFLVNDLPKGPSGKVQRLRLAESFQELLESLRDSGKKPAVNGIAHTVKEVGRKAPRTAVEEIIAETWAEVLDEEVRDVHDDFFGLGGHSLLAIDTLSRLRKRFSVDLSVNDFFTNPTVAQQALLVAGLLDGPSNGRSESKSPSSLPQDRAGLEEFLHHRHSVSASSGLIPQTDRSRPSPLSHAQERLWFLESLNPGLHAFYEPDAVRLRGELDLRCLQEALNAIIARHEVLRTLIRASNEGPVQTVLETWTVEIKKLDLSDRSPQARAAELDRLLIEEPQRLFDWTAEPPVRAALVRMDAQDHVLILTLHHAICDGWSFGVLCRELEHYYRSLLNGRHEPLPPPPVQYRDYASWQRRQVEEGKYEKELSFWKEYLRGAPPALDLPTKGPRPEVFTHRGEKRIWSLGRDATEKLRRFSRQEEVSLFTVLTAGFNALLSRYTGQEDIVLGIPLANRDRPELLSLFGFLIDFQALRTDLSGNPTFRELLKRVRHGMLEVNAHRAIPFNKVVEAVRPQREPGRAPVFQTMLIWKDRHVQFQFLDLPGLTASHVQSHAGAAKYDLTLWLTDAGEELWIEGEYCTDLFTAEMIERLVAHFQTLLAGAMADPDACVSRLPLLTPDERRQILVEWNETQADYPKDALLHELFEAQAARTPTKVAVVCEGQTLSYAELNQRAEQLAQRLRALGVGREVLVALYADRSLETVVGLLGILKAGGAYLPLDPLYPLDRLAFMLEDAQPLVVLTQHKRKLEVPTHHAHVLCLDDFGPSDISRKRTEGGSRARRPQESTSLAYVLYTSGSTGKPKGVQISHRAVINLLTSMRRTPGLEANDVMLAVTTLAFDIAGLEIFLPLTTGARVVIASREVAGDGGRLGNLIRESGATVMQATPATWRMLLHAGWEGNPRLKILCGGEALSPDLAENLLPRCAELWNLYGPTETTIWSTVSRVWPDQSITIGRPIANTQTYVLNPELQPVPVGVAGELFLGGDGLSRGYLNRPELSADRFISDPFRPELGARLYRTGDQVRYRKDGTIEYQGRLDHQVKIRGFRIELGEIEAVLSRHPLIHNQVVVAREDATGGKRLVAYVVCRERAVSVGDLREFLRAALPDYMIPSTFVSMDALPMTPNGKVDRKALPVPETPRLESGPGYVAPRTKVEQQLAAIWAKLLELDRVGVHDSFFDLGGHSLLAVRMLEQVNRRLQSRLTVTDVFRTPTVAQLAQRIADPKDDETMPHAHHLTVLRAGRGTSPVVIVGWPGLASVLHSHLPSDVPIWWLKVDGFHTSPFEIRPIPEIAKAFADELLSAAPAGSLTVIGFSFGGLLAFDLTRRLRQARRTVHTLVLESTSPVMLQCPPEAEQEPLAADRRTLVKRFQHHLALLRTMPPSSWLSYFWNRTYERLCVGLGGELPQHLPWLLRVRIRLGAAFSSSRASNLMWWKYGPQALDRAKTYNPAPCPGPIYLGGRAEWLDTNGPAWEPLVTGKVIRCPSPFGEDHFAVTNLPGAEAWLSLIRAWSGGSQGIEMRSILPSELSPRLSATHGDKASVPPNLLSGVYL